ncbi:MAG UNVERIFIED_CONTAM: hypothetical protein LVR18_51550 [Planctomycetaceae bacterium]
MIDRLTITAGRDLNFLDATFPTVTTLLKFTAGHEMAQSGRAAVVDRYRQQRRTDRFFRW